MTLSDAINRKIESILQASTWTSAGGKNPVDNFIKEARGFTDEDLEAEIEQNLETSKFGRDTEKTSETVQLFEKGNVGEIQKFSQQQFGNVRSLATNPFQFFLGMFKGKLAKGAGIAALAFLFFEVVSFIIKELLKPGRLLDRRFKIIADQQILIFTNRKLQQELKQGFRQVIVTTIQGLRGGRNQISGNLYHPQKIPNDFIDTRRAVIVPSPKAQGFTGVFQRKSGRFGR